MLTLFGTRPEAIKLAPVIRALEAIESSPDGGPRLSTINVCSSQHTDLLAPFVRQFGLRIDHDLQVMSAAQTPSEVLSRVIAGMASLISQLRPGMVLVQGDTMTALAGALAARFARVPVGHVEAGLRTHDSDSPFPEEINRRLIGQAATLHFAATEGNVRTLLAEGVDPKRVMLTGNPIVDALQTITGTSEPSAALLDLVEAHRGQRLIVLTTHRRENFGSIMGAHLQALRRFVDRHADVTAIFPVHPNPSVRSVAEAELRGAERIIRVDPLGYSDFVHLLSRAWLIASDSGGIQEEAPSLGVPVLILRDTTERPEVLDCGLGRLVGHDGAHFEQMLEVACDDAAWFELARGCVNPFGDGRAGERIADHVRRFLDISA